VDVPFTACTISAQARIWRRCLLGRRRFARWRFVHWLQDMAQRNTRVTTPLGTLVPWLTCAVGSRSYVEKYIDARGHRCRGVFATGTLFSNPQSRIIFDKQLANPYWTTKARLARHGPIFF